MQKYSISFLMICQFFGSEFIAGYIIEPGPVVIATKGAIWPKPKEQSTSDRFSIVRPSLLKFEIVNENCTILEEAIKRYRKIISSQIHPPKHRQKNRRAPFIVRRPKWSDSPLFDGFLDEVIVNLTFPCEERPSEFMEEKYFLTVANGTSLLSANTIWGILRGLESFSQLLVVTEDLSSLRINATEIVDEPRFSHRGLLVDTSRHYINVFTLQQILDGMAYTKFNVFHWHIVDDHAFPYESRIFPELSAQGAYHPTLTYTQQQVAEVIEYARLRGIRTIAEFDTPGHTRSWGVSHPEILTACGEPYVGRLGPIDPTKNVTYEFMQKLLSEVVDVFPDSYVHLGGDEVGFECWESSPSIEAYMAANNLTKFEQLEEEYIQRIVDMNKDLEHKSIVWQEVFENGVRLAPGTIVHIWTGDSSKLLNRVTNASLPALLSSCWYLDHLSTGGDWHKYYVCDPHNFDGTAAQKRLVLGGEACMWAEVVDNTNILQRIFPRANAAAERLWSPEHVKDLGDAERRLEEHTCRMKSRGLPAQPPNNPGYCI